MAFLWWSTSELKYELSKLDVSALALFPRQGLGKISLSFTNQKFTHRQRCRRVSGYVTLFLLKRFSGNSQSSPHCMICSRRADCEKNGLSGSKLTHSLAIGPTHTAMPPERYTSLNATDAARAKSAVRAAEKELQRAFIQEQHQSVGPSVCNISTSQRAPAADASQHSVCPEVDEITLLAFSDNNGFSSTE